MLKRAKERYEKQIETHRTRRKSSLASSSEETLLTRSQSVPFDNSLCFFCQSEAAYRHPLHKVATENAGQALRDAVEKSGDDKLRVKLCSAIDPKDAHAIDIRYHKRCWTTHVHAVLRA